MITPEHEQWHRQTAILCNNRAWELAVQPRTESGDREMLDAAHTSAWHWALVGTELNRMRATMRRISSSRNCRCRSGVTSSPFIAKSKSPRSNPSVSSA